MNTYDTNRITDKIKDNNSDIVILEGFEMTGKSTVISKLCEANDDLVVLNNNYDLLTPSLLPYKYRFALGLSQLRAIDMINSSKHTNYIPIIDRSIVSSYVYNIIHSQGIPEDTMTRMINAFREMTKSKNVHIIHMYHDTVESAQLLYESSQKDNNHMDKYDQFNSFYDYYNNYLEANEKFEEFYSTYLSDNILVSFYCPTEIDFSHI